MLTMSEKMVALNGMLAQKNAITPSQLKLSTMTIFSRLDVPPGFDLKKIIEFFLHEGQDKMREHLGLDIHVVFPIRKSKKTSRGKAINNFFNQLTFWYKDGTKKSVKIFINGNVHVTGCRSLKEYVGLVYRICNFMDVLFPGDGANRCHATDIELQMVNTNFSINMGLDLSKLKRILLDKGMCATYDREVYPGLNLKVPTSPGREASVLIFISGNIIITGVKSFMEVYEAYKFITETVASSAHDISKRRLQSTTTEKKRSTVVTHRDGYEEHILDSIMVW